MLETVDLSASISKKKFKSVWDELEIRLGQLQRDMRAAGIPTIVVLDGWDAAGKGRVLNGIMQALDPRGFDVFHFDPAQPHEQWFPVLRRYWLRLPATGHITVYDLSWYTEVVAADVDGGLDHYGRERAYERIRSFERQLSSGGAVIFKFFFHISQDEQSNRLKKLRKKQETAWKVGDSERRRNRRYNEYIEPLETMFRETSTGDAPWTLVPATNRRFATLKVAETLAAGFENALRRKAAPLEEEVESSWPARRISPLDNVDLDLAVSAETYERLISDLQSEARALQHRCYERRVPAVCVFEGWDTAGKGGAIRRLTKQLDPRGYTVVPVGAPDGIERRHNYLWRFWKAVPPAGHLAIFDRSWYGRVLVERIEGFCSVQDWQRAFQEINEFEEQICEHGAPLFKFWLHISPEEQLSRLEARQDTPHKHWKVTDEDWRNREKWDAYHNAVSDMIERTSTPHALWTIVAANDKYHARVTVLQRVVEGLQAALA